MIRRISLLAVSSLLSVVASLSMAHASTITVTTLDDVSGGKACSLRDAIKASATKTAVGGCAAGQQYYTDTVQLAAGTYTLTQGELVVNGSMNIVGDAASDPFSTDPLTGAEPARLPLATTIVAASGSRIFNTSISLSPLNISNVILSGGTANGATGGDSGYGGSILAGGTVYLSRVQINNATAAQQGGAIFIEGAQSNLTATAVSFTGNNAPQGAVVGMSCFDNLIPTVRAFTLSQVSATGNGSSNTSTIFDFCGQATTSITSSTIAKNTTSNSTASSALSLVGNVNTRLGSSSTLTLVSNTITENNTPVAILYGISTGLSLTNNIIAFNNGNLDCQYQGANDPATGLPPLGTSATLNLFASTSTPSTAATSKCSLHPSVTTTDTNIYATSSQQLSDFVSPLGLYGGSDLLGYLPSGSQILHKGATTSVCGTTDQRGLIRGSGVPITGSTSQTINCDIGALELSILTTNYDSNGVNVSYANVVNTTVSTTGLTDAQAAKLKQQNADYLNAYKSTYRYREVVMAVTSNDSAQEEVSANTSTIGLLTDTTKYTITGSDSGNIHCEWNPVMKQLLASRNDGTTTPGSTTDSCQYTITEVANPSNTSTATASFAVNSIAPIANNFTVTLPYGASSIPLDILSHASDDGNGPVGSINYPNVVINGKTVPKPVFYSDNRIVNGVVTNIPANIIITTKPTQGHIVAQYQEPCANNNVNTTQNICYGGTLTYVNDNLYSPFNDSFTYQVLNYDLSPSGSATVTVINTATTTDQTKAGGGSLGLGALLALISLVFIRRRATA